MLPPTPHPTVYIETHGCKLNQADSQTLARKFRELRLAVALEREFEKDELLERYLNQVYFGSGAYGIAAAAEEFFRVTPRDLTVDQAALLAGLIRAPGTLDPRANPGVAASRRDQVMTQMVAAGYLEPDEAAITAWRTCRGTSSSGVMMRFSSPWSTPSTDPSAAAPWT
jgi:membrane peptidoglycan carboxypeptidase